MIVDINLRFLQNCKSIIYGTRSNYIWDVCSLMSSVILWVVSSHFIDRIDRTWTKSRENIRPILKTLSKNYNITQWLLCRRKVCFPKTYILTWWTENINVISRHSTMKSSDVLIHQKPNNRGENVVKSTWQENQNLVRTWCCQRSKILYLVHSERIFLISSEPPKSQYMEGNRKSDCGLWYTYVMEVTKVINLAL